MKLALLQLNSGADMAANIAAAEALVAEAAGQGAELIATPENTFLMEAPGVERVFYTQEDHPGVRAARGWAKRHGVWVLVGSVSCHPGEGRDPRQAAHSMMGVDASLRWHDKTYNRSLLITPAGDIAAQYDKIHLFDVDVGDGQSYRESARMLGGNCLVTAPLTINHQPPTTLGLSICYDVRFPQLYRALAKAGAEILSVPAAFTQVTGEAHWHVLLRARAIENGCFVIAPAQCGTHPGNRKTYGHSLVVDPWGRIIADGGTEVGVVMADIDLAEVTKVRGKIPSLEHDREFS